MRKLLSGRLVIATHNKGKVPEIAALVRPHGIEPVSAGELGLPEPEETGTTFRDNALLKARQAADLSGLPALADDSGLCVDALGGEPGIFSARWGGPDKDFALAMRRVEERLAEKKDAPRDAHFVCALALVWPDGDEVEVEGRIDGTLVWPPRGDRGFGYDPMFVMNGRSDTCGEMEPAEKHALSHRARAWAKLAERVLG